MEEATEKTLWDLKPGDVVMRWRHPCDTLEKIVRVTGQQLVLEHGGKYWKRDGFNVGGNTWNLSRISIPTPEEIADLQMKEEKARIYNTLRATKWQENIVPYDVAKKIVALLTGGNDEPVKQDDEKA